MRIEIDGRPLEVEPGVTVLEAARLRGIEIPTLCHVDGMEPNTSCFLCVVEIQGDDSLKPACALPVAEGMMVLTQSEKVTAARRTALELLFSDHAGGCIAPCVNACPAHLDVPVFLRALREGRLGDAMAILKTRLALPAVLGYVCRAHCAPACLRGEVDSPIDIRASHRLAAETDYAGDEPWAPVRVEPSGRRVAIVGAGPAGLAAAWNLALDGHQCIVFDAEAEAGGLLRRDIWEGKLPVEVVDREIRAIRDAGVKFHMNWRLGHDASLDDLRERFDAVVIAIGAGVDPASSRRSVDMAFLGGMGLSCNERGVEVNRDSLMTGIEGVFAAGDVVAGRAGTVVRAVGAGPVLRASVAQHLAGGVPSGEPDAFRFWRRYSAGEKEALRARTGTDGAPETPVGCEGSTNFSVEAARCLQCHCVRLDDCRLRRYGIEYGVNPYRFRGDRRELDSDVSHAAVIYEPGKCILCGLCIAIAREEGEELGLSFAGRGFPTRVVVPLGGTFSDGLRRAAERAARECPTAALSLRKSRG